MPQTRLTLNSYAKLNLYLEVVKRRDDGYHEIKTIMAPIELHDTVSIERAAGGINIFCNDSSVPCDERNLAYKAAALFFKNTSISGGGVITIQKKIPVGAGLGGGSSNAAATLIGLNSLFGEPLPKERLLEIASGIGADVPFFIQCVPVYAQGIGDVFVSHIKLPELYLLLVNPKFEVSARWAYQNLVLKEEKNKFTPSFNQLNTVHDVAVILKNSLEEPVSKKYPVIKEMENELKKSGCIGTLMSGSGPTVFGIFSSYPDASSSMKQIKSVMPDFLIFLTKTKGTPIR